MYHFTNPFNTYSVGRSYQDIYYQIQQQDLMKFEQGMAWMRDQNQKLHETHKRHHMDITSRQLMNRTVHQDQGILQLSGDKTDESQSKAEKSVVTDPIITETY